MGLVWLDDLKEFAEGFEQKARALFAKKADIPKTLPASGGDADTVNGHTVNANVPAGAKFTDTVYQHPIESGNKHIPVGGTSGQILRYKADGEAMWGDDKDTQYENMKGASSSADGAAGLVPVPGKGKQNSFLKGDGTWGNPTPSGIGAVAKSGDTMTGTLGSSKTTSTYLAGNQGQAIINSTAGAGAYTMLDKLNSTNGYFTDGVFQGKRLLQYTAKSTVDAGTNSVTKSVTLLNEDGNTSFPGTVTAQNFKLASSSGKLNSFLRGDGEWIEMLEATDADIDAIIAGTFK